MLETYTLKQQLESSRKELSRTLYQHDAACRVIARLLKEREQWAQNQESNSAVQELQGIPQESLTRITNHSNELVKMRKQRRVSPNLTSPASLQSLKEPTMTQLLHGSSGVSCIAVQEHSASEQENSNMPAGERSLWLTGAQDGSCCLFDRNSEQLVAQLRGHTSTINDVAFHPNLDILFTCSDDKTSRIWSSNENGEYKTHYTMKNHSDAVTGLDLHPIGDYYATASRDKSWSFYDVASGVQYCNLPSEEELTAIRFHPDGVIAATGTATGKIQLWNLKSQKCVATIDEHQADINSLCFSENGFELATASRDQSAKVVDLRKMKASKSFEFEDNVQVANFDHSGVYLGIGVGSVVQLYQSKVWEHLNTLSHHSGAVTGIQFGEHSKSVISSSLDRQVLLYQTEG